jgi:hypothetical protein
MAVNVHNTAIVLDAAGTSMGYDWMIIDGNHRLASAIYRKAAAIRATVAGDVSKAEKLLVRICGELPPRAPSVRHPVNWGSP